MNEPLLAITMGDPAGIGPETIAGAWADPAFHALCRAVVIGHPAVLRRAINLRQLNIRVEQVDDIQRLPSNPSVMPVLMSGTEEAAQVPPAAIDARGGQAAYAALLDAAQLARDGQVDGICTAPLHKAALHAAGHHYPGHTELLAELCGVDEVAMMLYLGAGGPIRGRVGLGVAHVTLHTALRQVFDQLTPDAIVAKAKLADTVVRALLKGDSSTAPPRLGACALNPHGGESGLFGDEEQRIIRPAVEAARRQGLQLEGPLPADTLMVRAAAGDFDAVVAMYHDQGHIALKLLGMHRAVNITLGLPIIRTSVAHGTAFDLAWQGRAETSGMVEAVRVAAQLVHYKQHLQW